MVDFSRDVSDFAAIYNLVGFEAPSFVDNVVDVDVSAHVDGLVDSSNKLDAVTGFDAFMDLVAPIEFDAFIDSDDFSGPEAAVNHSYITRCDSAGCDL